MGKQFSNCFSSAKFKKKKKEKKVSCFSCVCGGVEMFKQHPEEAKWAKATGSEGQREVHTCLKRRQVIKREHEGAGFTGDFH